MTWQICWLLYVLLKNCKNFSIFSSNWKLWVESVLQKYVPVVVLHVIYTCSCLCVCDESLLKLWIVWYISPKEQIYISLSYCQNDSDALISKSRVLSLKQYNRWKENYEFEDCIFYLALFDKFEVTIMFKKPVIKDCYKVLVHAIENCYILSRVLLSSQISTGCLHLVEVLLPMKTWLVIDYL